MLHLENVSQVKTAGPLDWIQENPGWAALIAGGLGGGGALARRLLGKPSAATTALQQELRGKAQEGGLHFLTSRRPTESIKDPQNWMNRLRNWAAPKLDALRNRQTTLGERPMALDEFGEVVAPKKGVTVGIDPSEFTASPAELTTGGLGTHSKAWEDIAGTTEEIVRKGKAFEQGPELGLGELFAPGQSLATLMQRAKIPLRAPGRQASPERAEYLNRLQDTVRKRYPEFVLKPHELAASSGNFPTEAGRWGDIYQDYLKRIKPEVQMLTKEHALGIHGDKSLTNVIAEKLRKDPAFPGMQLEAIMQDPQRALAQQKLNLVRGAGGKPFEYRVHAMRGEVPEALSYNRYMPKRELLRRLPILGGMLPSKRTGSAQDAAAWVRQNVLPKMPKDYRQGTYGLDVARVRNPDGSYGYKLIELNPTSGAGAGASGFLDANINPMITQDVTKWVTGRDARATTAAKMLGYGGGTAGATGIAAKATQPEPEFWEGPANRLRALRSRLTG